MKWWIMASILLLGLILVIGVLAQFYPQFEEQFIAMGVLGENEKASNYFPNNSSSIHVGTLVHWHLYLYNHMIVPKNVSVRVKILNSTLPGPNDTDGTPSPVASFLNISQRLASNETRILPFFFAVTEATVVDNSVGISEIQVNNVTLPVDESASNSSRSFRLVFELWSYDEGSNVYVFSWETEKKGKGSKPVWNQIWFNVIYSS